MFALPLTRQRIAGFVLLLGFASLLGISLMTPFQVDAQGASPLLGTADSFAVLGASAVTNTNATVLDGNLGIWPGTAISGFPPGIVNGTTHTTDAVAQQAQADALAAYNSLAGRPCPPGNVLTGQDLGGLTLTAGVYCFSSSAGLTGTLTLDAEDDPNAEFIFQMGTTLDTAENNASVVFVDGIGNDCNVWWQVGSSATIQTNTSFVGNILASASITLVTNANVAGRAIALNAAVTMDDNNVGPTDCVNRSLSITKDDGGARVWPGEVINYALSYQNTGNVTLYNVTLSDTIPANTTFNAGLSAAGWVCDGGNCTLNVGTVQPLTGGNVAFAVTVNDGTTNDISNTASITSGSTTATDSETTTVRGQEDDDTPAPPATGIPPAATAPPPNATAGPVPTNPGVSVTLVPTGVNPLGTPIFSANGTPVVVINGTPIVLVNGTPVGPLNTGVFGLPNTGGAEPKATYWLTLTPGR